MLYTVAQNKLDVLWTFRLALQAVFMCSLLVLYSEQDLYLRTALVPVSYHGHYGRAQHHSEVPPQYRITATMPPVWENERLEEQ